jgi:hypothetical protein
MQRPFRFWDVPAQPAVQLGKEIRSSFIVTSFTLSEQFEPALKFDVSSGVYCNSFATLRIAKPVSSSLARADHP